MKCGKDADLLEGIVEKGNVINEELIHSWHTEKLNRWDNGRIRGVRRLTISLDNKIYYIVKKDCDIKFNPVEQQLRILLDCKKFGFNIPTCYYNGQYLYMFDLTENETFLLLDLGKSGKYQYFYQDSEYFFPIHDRIQNFEDLSNFKELVEETPKKLALFEKHFECYLPTDPFLWLIQYNCAYLYVSDVERVRKLGDSSKDTYAFKQPEEYHPYRLNFEIYRFFPSDPEIEKKIKEIYERELKKASKFKLSYGERDLSRVNLVQYKEIIEDPTAFGLNLNGKTIENANKTATLIVDREHVAELVGSEKRILEVFKVGYAERLENIIRNSVVNHVKRLLG